MARIAKVVGHVSTRSRPYAMLKAGEWGGALASYDEALRHMPQA